MFSKIEKSSVVAVALAITLAFGFSAFTADPKTTENTFVYGRLADGTWIPVDDANYQCSLSDQICKGEFSSPNPTPETEPDVVLEDDGTYMPK